MSSAVSAPLRSIRALVTSVVPWTSVPRSPPPTVSAPKASLNTVSTARLGSSDVVRVFPMMVCPSCPTIRRSVKVPPMSTPTLYISYPIVMMRIPFESQANKEPRVMPADTQVSGLTKSGRCPGTSALSGKRTATNVQTDPGGAVSDVRLPAGGEES